MNWDTAKKWGLALVSAAIASGAIYALPLSPPNQKLMQECIVPFLCAVLGLHIDTPAYMKK